MDSTYCSNMQNTTHKNVACDDRSRVQTYCCQLEHGPYYSSIKSDVPPSPICSQECGSTTIRSSSWNSQVVGKLIAAKADLDVQDTNGCTALWLATYNNFVEIVHSLLIFRRRCESSEYFRLYPTPSRHSQRV
jgi:hypothetical protein